MQPIKFDITKPFLKKKKKFDITVYFVNRVQTKYVMVKASSYYIQK